jgi:acyl-CoA synthetase (AMP-forming)/AMP-acid ligase II
VPFLEEVAETCRRRADHPYVVHDGRRVTFGEFDRLTNRSARALRTLGVVPGDRVTVGLGNSIEWLIGAFGALKAGGILNPVNPGLGAKELGYVLSHAAPRVIVTDSASAPALGAVRPPAATLASFGPAEGAEPLDRLLDVAADSPVELALGPDDGSTLLYTSGTTGNPKGVLFTHGRTGGANRFLIDGLGIRPEDTIVFVGPLFHGNAWSAASAAMQAGSTVVFPKTFHATEFWPLVHESGATVMITLGTVLAILLTLPPSELERTSGLRVILGLGAAPIRGRLKERFGVRDIVECFGSTDAGVVTLEPLDTAPRPGSSGPPLAGVSIRICDDDGNELPTGQVGEITVRSKHRMAEYFRDPAETRRALRGDWFLTGDLGYVDGDGWLYFVDRKRDVIRRGGENISSVAVEKTLREHPKVLEAAVIGVPDPVLGQEVKAYVVASEPVGEEELRAFAAARLARFQVPRFWEFRDSLPKTPTQRIEKYKLRRESGDQGRPRLG